MRLSLFLYLLVTGSYLLAQPVVAFENLGVFFNRPVDVTNAGDGTDRLFVVESRGRIVVYDPVTGTTQGDPYLDIQARVSRDGGEQGLLGLVFHPDFPNTPYFYVHYISNGVGIPDNGQSVIARFSAPSPGIDTAITASELILLRVDQPEPNHNAGDLAFGPDGMLYIPMGDGGGGGDPFDNGQDSLALLGKLLRIDVDNPDPGMEYGIPTNNPFVDNPAISDEIWALGLRNPWRISFDRLTGDLWIGDVGQNAREEIDFQPASSTGGENYGWDCREGLIEFGGSSSADCVMGGTYVDPVFDYPRDFTNGGISLTGGFVYRGPRADDLLGHYICADFASNNFFIITPDDADGRELIVQSTQDSINTVSSFGEGENGDLYVLSLTGALRRITSEAALPVSLTDWRTTTTDKQVTLSWTTEWEENTADFRLERSADGREFHYLTTLPAAGNRRNRADYRYVDRSPLTGRSYYRLWQRDLDGKETLFPVRTVTFGGEEALRIFPNPSTGRFTLALPELPVSATVRARVLDGTGRVVYTRLSNVTPGTRRLEYHPASLPAGSYQLEVSFLGQRRLLPLLLLKQ